MKNFICTLFVMTVAVGCVSSPKRSVPVDESLAVSAPPPPQLVTLVTSKGEIVIEVNREKAPISASNFVAYVDAKYYDNTAFHRVIDGFMVQGGGFALDANKILVRKPTRSPILCESQNGLKNVRGSVAMARRRDADSATSQFFINHANNARLDYPSFDGHGYAVFGRVVSGMDVVDAIATVKTGRAGQMDNVPVEPVMLQSVTLKQP